MAAWASAGRASTAELTTWPAVFAKFRKSNSAQQIDGIGFPVVFFPAISRCLKKVVFDRKKSGDEERQAIRLCRWG